MEYIRIGGNMLGGTWMIQAIAARKREGEVYDPEFTTVSASPELIVSDAQLHTVASANPIVSVELQEE